MVTFFHIDIIVENPRSVALRLPQRGKKKKVKPTSRGFLTMHNFFSEKFHAT